MINAKKIYGCPIPPKILSASSKILSDSEKILLSKIIILSKSKGYCYALNKHLSRELGRSDRQISRGVNSLVKKGYLRTKILHNENGQVFQRQIMPTEKVYLLLANNGEEHLVNYDYIPTSIIGHTPPTNNGQYKYGNSNNVKPNKINTDPIFSFEDFIKNHHVIPSVKKVIEYYLSAYKDTWTKEHPSESEKNWVLVVKKIKQSTASKKISNHEWELITEKNLTTNYKHQDYTIYMFMKEGYWGMRLNEIRSKKA